MMTNPLPHPDATMPAVLDFLTTSHRYGIRNRCLYRLRLVLPYKDIANLRVGNILNKDGSIVEMIYGDGWALRVDIGLAVDLLCYARKRLQRYNLENLNYIRGHEHLFVTQKSLSFSPNWLAQLYFHLDKSISIYYKTNHSLEV
jgi:hypothetical protein